MRGRWLAATAATAAAATAAAASALCVAACDPGEPAKPRTEPAAVAPGRDFASGSRLRARYHVIEGLAEVFTTFHDVGLDADCAYADESGAHVGPNASSYCLPNGMARHREGRGPYLDPACAAPAAFTSVGPTGAAATLALLEPRDACVTTPAVHVALSPRTRRSFLRDADGACVEIEAASLQPLGDPVPLERFVHATEHVEPRQGRIAPRELVGDDGSRRVVGGFDQLRNEPSRVGTVGDGSSRWLPARVAFVGGGDLLFADGACAAPVAAKIARTATCPLHAAVVLEGSCGAGSYFELGERVTAVFARDRANACVSRTAPEQLTFLLGATIPTAAYAPVSSIEVGNARVRRQGMTAAGDAPVMFGDAIDVDRGQSCAVAGVTDGTLRCLPTASEVVSFFADVECTEPAFARPITGCEGGVSPRFVRDAFDVPVRVFEVGRELPAVYTVDAGRCVQFTPVVSSRLFAASELDTRTFPKAELAAE